MIYQIWVHFIIFFMENHYQDWTNSWYAAEQTYKIAPCENHKKKDGGGEKTQKIRTLNCRGRIWQWKPYSHKTFVAYGATKHHSSCVIRGQSLEFEIMTYVHIYTHSVFTFTPRTHHQTWMASGLLSKNEDRWYMDCKIIYSEGRHSRLKLRYCQGQKLHMCAHVS